MARKFNPEFAHVLHNPARWWHEPPERLVFLLDPREGSRVIEVGVGTGYFLLHLARMYPEVEFVGTDVQEEMLEIVRGRARGLRNVKVVESEETRIPLRDGCADAVLLAHVFHELEDPDATMGEVMRVLRPRGRVVIVDWKPVPTPFGPPLEERIPSGKVIRTLTKIGFMGVREYDLYTYHYVVAGVKGKVASPSV